MSTEPTIETTAGPDVAPLTEVPVAAGILQATAELLQRLADFLDTDAQARTRLGRFLARHHFYEDMDFTGDPRTDGVLVLCELNEAADLLQALAASGANTASG